MMSFDQLLRESAQRHGHLCPGQVIGVRMAMLGCALVGLDDPKSLAQRKKLIVCVEIDRCATDAIEVVTGCKLGKRTLKVHNYGIMAATFINLDRKPAYRIVAREESRDLSARYAPELRDPHARQLKAYTLMSDEELFSVQPVEVDLPPWELPGPTQRKVRCCRCGQVIRDGREITQAGQTLCVPCSGRAYFRPLVSLHEDAICNLNPDGLENFTRERIAI